MAASSRSEDLAIDRWPIAAELERDPCRFEFFQAVRLLELMAANRQVVGRFTNPGDEALRFGAHASVAFPASEVQSLERPEHGPVRMQVNFMGLTGPTGMLPLTYSALLIERVRARDTAMRDFFDIFNHRMISLFCQAWEKYRFNIPYERGERDRFSHHVLALLGLATPGLQNRQQVPDDSLLFYSGLLAAHARSATGLRQVLGDYFGVPVEIEQFVGAWYPVETESQCELGEDGGYSEQLGLGAVVGDEIWDQQSRIRIHLGPLTMAQYEDFLPGGEGYRQLRTLADFYAGDEYDVEVRLILRRDEVPACELVADSAMGRQLGWTSWVKTAEFTRDPGETVLEL
ncbi:MAG TPA: type VI secretion system baseplate subunit TssG [Bryobacteraceae bacterium]|nr:type VI secretion system baseplate subunit TssG [Bryobacteraceae bacterium]